MAVRPMTDEEAERIFGGGLVILGQKRPQPSSENSATPGASSATEPDPMQPAVDAIEEWGRKTFGGDPTASQEAHDLWLQRQSPKQLKVLASNLGDLMRVREGRKQPTGDDLADPAGMGGVN